ncbi:PH domain-containing protein [Gordonia sp. YY1]|uniref:PH domain-containing protein n=1 Tax=Gordonia sp. YY1 TaxID=396712 RepID=UPI00133129D1|nr:PH domain-containing protein [Gordonia sp. YY1]
MPTDSSDPAAQPPRSSRTPRDAAAADDSLEITYPVTFRMNRLAYFTVPMLALVVVLLIGASPWFAFAFVVPAVLWFWIHRLRTIVTEDGLRAVGFSTTEVAWSDIAGLQFPKWSSVRAVLHNGERVRLPAIGFRDLPALSIVSGGRIPDPFEAAANPDE